MHEGLLRQAAMPVPRVVLGLLLRPYSIGHELLIQADSSDFAKPETALISLVWICSNSWKENTRNRLDPLMSLKLWLWRRRCGRRDFKKELEKFQAYREEGSLEFPLSELIETDGRRRGRATGAPFLLKLQQFVCFHFKLSESEAWDYPFGMAKMHWSCMAEEEGGIKIRNEHDESFEAYIEEQERKGREQCQA